MGESVDFRGAPVRAVIDRSPRPERLPSRLLELDGELQAALVHLPVTQALSENPPRIEEIVITATHRYRIASAPRHLGHAFECPCVVSSITA